MPVSRFTSTAPCDSGRRLAVATYRANAHTNRSAPSLQRRRARGRAASWHTSHRDLQHAAYHPCMESDEHRLGAQHSGYQLTSRQSPPPLCCPSSCGSRPGVASARRGQGAAARLVRHPLNPSQAPWQRARHCRHHGPLPPATVGAAPRGSLHNTTRADAPRSHVACPPPRSNADLAWLPPRDVLDTAMHARAHTRGHRHVVHSSAPRVRMRALQGWHMHT